MLLKNASRMMRLELASDAVYKPIIDLIVKEYMV
jgi:hypothetical protein